MILFIRLLAIDRLSRDAGSARLQMEWTSFSGSKDIKSAMSCLSRNETSDWSRSLWWFFFLYVPRRWFFLKILSDSSLQTHSTLLSIWGQTDPGMSPGIRNFSTRALMPAQGRGKEYLECECTFWCTRCRWQGWSDIYRCSRSGRRKGRCPGIEVSSCLLLFACLSP